MSQFLKMSDATTLALHALAKLADHFGKGALSVRTIAADLEASEAHLSKVMQRMERFGLVSSTRGPKGGFRMNSEARERSFLEVYELFEGPASMGSCLMSRTKCTNGSCILGDLLCEVNTQVKQNFSEKKLGTLICAKE